jgi:phosphate starvation-inducible membrane PsiE
MVPNLPEWKRIHSVFQRGLTLVEYAGPVVIGFATTYAMVEEVGAMIHAARVTLADLLLMFLYLEVLAMIGQYFNSGSFRSGSRCTSRWWRWLATSSSTSRN